MSRILIAFALAVSAVIARAETPAEGVVSIAIASLMKGRGVVRKLDMVSHGARDVAAL